MSCFCTSFFSTSTGEPFVKNPNFFICQFHNRAYSTPTHHEPGNMGIRQAYQAFYIAILRFPGISFRIIFSFLAWMDVWTALHLVNQCNSRNSEVHLHINDNALEQMLTEITLSFRKYPLCPQYPVSARKPFLNSYSRVTSLLTSQHSCLKVDKNA